MIISNGFKYRAETYLILIMSNSRLWKFEIKKPKWIWDWQADFDNR